MFSTEIVVLFKKDRSATTLLPDHAKLRGPSMIMVHSIPLFFLGIACLGSAQVGADLNS